MSKNLRTGLLVAILAVPVFTILFLYGFNENSYDIEVYYPNGIRGDTPGQTHTVKDFSLIDHQGNTYSFDAGGQEKVYAVNFFFTRCGSFCPAVMSQFSRVQDRFEEEERVNLLSISVDPEFDKPEIMAKYAEGYNVDYNQWKLLTGEKEEVYDIIINQFVLPIEDASVVTPDFLHSDKIVLVDSKGRIRGYYSGQDEEEVNRLIGEIKILLNQFDS